MPEFLIIELNIKGVISEDLYNFDICMQSSSIPGMFPKDTGINYVNCNGLENTKSKKTLFND